MTLELYLRRPFLPRVLWAREDDPRPLYHWVGERRSEQGSAASGGESGKPQDKKSEQKYRPLDDLTLGDVEGAYHLFEYQLLPTQGNWIGRDFFCRIPLKRIRDGRPPEVFGRVKTCFPSDGELDNIQEMELYFPRKESAPDLLHIHRDEISQSSPRPVQSYFVQVRVLASVEEKAELAETIPLLSAHGFYPDFETGYLDLLELPERSRSAHPWLYVIGSRWFATIPDSRQMEISSILKDMVRQGIQIFNYHPIWLAKEVHSLNEELGYQYGFTPQVLVEPRNPKQIWEIVNRTFNGIFLNELR
jgi:hypothetical protein